MPRTIFGPGPSYPHDARGLRSSAECKHREQQEWSFLWPFTISAEIGETQENNTEGRWGWQHNYLLDKRFDKCRDDLVAEDYRRFCFKDCALYTVSTNWTLTPLRSQLFDRIYRRWYPSRDEDLDISHGAFFCHLVGFHSSQVPSPPAPVTMKEVLAFHKDLCSRLERFIPELCSPIPWTRGSFEPTEERSLLLPRVAGYKLRPTFKRCFLHLSAEKSDHSIDSRVMKNRGIRIVFLEEADAANHGCTEDAQQGIRRLREEEQGLEGAAVFHCDTVERAMRVILSTDPRRIEGREEWHGYYQHTLDSSTDTSTIPPEPCLCHRCIEEERDLAVEEEKISSAEEEEISVVEEEKVWSTFASPRL